MSLNKKINHKIISIGKRAKGWFYYNHLGKCTDDLSQALRILDLNIYQLISKRPFLSFNAERYNNMILPTIERLVNSDLSDYNSEMHDLVLLRKKLIKVNKKCQIEFDYFQENNRGKRIKIMKD